MSIETVEVQIPIMGITAVDVEIGAITIGGGVGTQEQISAKLFDPERSVLVDTTGTDVERGAALVAAYSAAKLLTPNGAALSATNRATVILPPGKYLLTAYLFMDTDFVDISALVPENPYPLNPSLVEIIPGLNDLANYTPQRVEVYSTTDNHVIYQFCADVRLSGFTIASLCTTAGSGRHALYLGSQSSAINTPSTYDRMYLYSRYVGYSNQNGGHTGVAAYSHLDGTWRNCVANGVSWRLTTNATEFRAKMYDCQCGHRSIAGDSSNSQIVGARFERVRTVGSSTLDPLEQPGESFGGCTTFGVGIDSTSVFIDCDGGNRSFGLGATAAGTFIRCRGGENSFGSTIASIKQGNFSGYAEDCWSGKDSFGGSKVSAKGTCSGTLVRCNVEGSTKSIRLTGANIRDSRLTTTTTGVDTLTLLDSDSVISNCDVLVLQGGTGIPINSGSALNVSVYDCRFNNLSNDDDGLGSNVTNLVVTPSGGVTDHGALTGLADDDHTQYALADGSRGTFATAAQGTDERVPTLAGLVSKLASVVSATASGIWNFSSTTRPTSSGTGTPAATSLITLADGDARYGANRQFILGSDATITAGSYTNVTGATVELEANSEYAFQGFLHIEALAALSRIQCRLAYTGTLQTVQGSICAIQTNGSAFPATTGGLLTFSFADVSSLDRIMPFTGFIRTNTAGTLTITSYRVSGSGSPLIKAGSQMRLQKL